MFYLHFIAICHIEKLLAIVFNPWPDGSTQLINIGNSEYLMFAVGSNFSQNCFAFHLFVYFLILKYPRATQL